jgi:lipopolysaccharide/colanic/teichoic acid biosynthesis glycosyltransferase
VEKIVRILQRRSSGTSGRFVQRSEQDEAMSPQQFRRMLLLEQRRCERSGRCIVLMLLESTDPLHGDDVGAQALRVITRSIRDTDITGWFEDATLGVIFTELGDVDSQTVTTALSSRILHVLVSSLGSDIAGGIQLSFQVLPGETRRSGDGQDPSDGEWFTGENRSGAEKALKRAIDIIGSLSAVILGSPLLLAIALAVKVTSPGPVLFRQTRMGRNGQPFTFLKFRSMQHGNSPELHREFVTKLIRGELDPATSQFKIVADPRITPLGRFLRRTSLDELPQFFNVLVGDMSLVGPRPPVPYEFACYKTWHRRRLADVRPGITGLWQVEGRSRVGFDDMVRLDLRYARTWSLWLDLTILFATPRAVVSGNGAH